MTKHLFIDLIMYILCRILLNAKKASASVDCECLHHIPYPKTQILYFTYYVIHSGGDSLVGLFITILYSSSSTFNGAS